MSDFMFFTLSVSILDTRCTKQTKTKMFFQPKKFGCVSLNLRPCVPHMQSFHQTGSRFLLIVGKKHSEKKLFRKLWRHVTTAISKCRSHTRSLKRFPRVPRQHGEPTSWGQGYPSSPEGQHIGLSDLLTNRDDPAATVALPVESEEVALRRSQLEPPFARPLGCVRSLAESQQPRGVNTEPLLVHKQTTRWHDWLRRWFGPVT